MKVNFAVNDNTFKALAGIALLSTWIALIVLKTPNAEALVDFCEKGLVGLGLYHGFTRKQGDGQAPANFPTNS